MLNRLTYLCPTYLWLVLVVLAWGIVGEAGAEEPRQEDSTMRVYISAFDRGDRGAIWGCQLNLKSGALKLERKLTAIEQPFFLALSPQVDGQQRLYATHAGSGFGKGEEEVIAFDINAESGELTELNRQSTRGAASCYLDVDSTGRTLLVANYTSGDVASLPIQSDGRLLPAASFVKHQGSSVDPKRQQEPHAHCFLASPDSRFALSADLGIDRVLVYQLKAKSGQVTLASEATHAAAKPGAGPRHLVFDPQGERVYVINEIGNTIAGCHYESASGRMKVFQEISTLPEGTTVRTHTADLKFTPDGRYLYGTNRGHDSIACYRVAADGRLTRIEIRPSLGKGPQNLAVTPDGRLLLCANMPGGNVAVFRIDQATGKLTPVGKPLEMPMPSCIMLAGE